MINLSEVPTPALLVHAGLLRSNIDLMARHARERGKRLRPHFKAHKCLAVARMQLDAGASGICAATENEATLLVRGGVRNVLLTSPVADPAKARRLAELAQVDPGFTVVVDHASQVQMFEATGASMQVMVDLDVGDHRTGISPGTAAVGLVGRIQESRQLRFAGLQGYSVRASHTEEDARADVSGQALRGVQETREMLEAAGIPVPLTSGASTATFHVDAAGAALDELQAGSYVFMDLAYRKLGGLPFHHAATVLATVISANQNDRVTLDAGFKAFATDRPFGPEVPERPELRYAWAGDEFGFLHGDGGLGVGDRVQLLPPHCDPTVNLYDRIYVHDGQYVLDVWSVMDRVPAASR